LLGIAHAVQHLDVIVVRVGAGLACWVHAVYPYRF
jgi:hypothetical protein